MRFKFLVIFFLLSTSSAAVSCSSGCDVGETWCDGTEILVCRRDLSGDDYWEDEDEDDECDFFCWLFELLDDSSDDDTYGEVRFDCAEALKTCQEVEKEDGGWEAVCRYPD